MIADHGLWQRSAETATQRHTEWARAGSHQSWRVKKFQAQLEAARDFLKTAEAEVGTLLPLAQVACCHSLRAQAGGVVAAHSAGLRVSAAKHGLEARSSKGFMADSFLQRSALVTLDVEKEAFEAESVNTSRALQSEKCAAAKRSFLEAEEEAAKAQELADAASKDASGRSEDVEAQRAAMQQSQKAAEALAKALSARKLVCSTESLSPEKVRLYELLPFVVCVMGL